jgi:hypothetical protein
MDPKKAVGGHVLAHASHIRLSVRKAGVVFIEYPVLNSFCNVFFSCIIMRLQYEYSC